MGEVGGYKTKRDEFIRLNKEYHALAKDDKPVDVVENVVKSFK
jgi:hypothetical protein